MNNLERMLQSESAVILDGDPALHSLRDIREFRSIVADRDRLVGRQRELIEAS